MDTLQFLHDYREAFGPKGALPLLFGYSDQPVAATEKIGGCFFKGLQAARDGVPVSLSAEVIGCGGGKLYTGFSDMPERVPRFVSLKEKYKETPGMVAEYVKSLGMKRAEKKYLNFVRIDKAETFDGFEGIMFYATPDMLSGLCGWASLVRLVVVGVIYRWRVGIEVRVAQDDHGVRLASAPFGKEWQREAAGSEANDARGGQCQEVSSVHTMKR